MLWSEAVVDGDNNGFKFRRETLAAYFSGCRIGCEERESSTVHVDDNRADSGGGDGVGDVKAEPEIAGGVNDDIRRFDTITRSLRSRDFEVEEAPDTAVDSEVRPARGGNGGGKYEQRDASLPWEIVGHFFLCLVRN